MVLLSFDTCFGACSAAVFETDARGGPFHNARLLASRYEEMDSGHAERLLPMIRDVMQEARAGFDGLDALSVASGPGSFTGTRIAISAARALALSHKLPVFGTTSLALMAARAAAELKDAIAGHHIVVCVDARKGQVYLQSFGATAHAPPASEPRVVSPREVDLGSATMPIIAVGSGAAALAAAQKANNIEIQFALDSLKPDARYASECFHNPLSPPTPLYLRPPDAKPSMQPQIARVNP